VTAAPDAIGRPARLGVDVSAALNLVGSLVKYLGPSALVPTVFAIAHDEPAWPFLAAGAAVTGFGLVLERWTRGADEVGIREGYLVVSLTWLLAAVYGALPYVLAGDPQLGRPVDALFEGMSGFTTTGSSAVADVEALSTSMQVWRQLTLWMGGIGVVALGLAVLPRLRVGGKQMIESELAGGGVEALSGRIRDTVRRFWVLYLAITAAGFLALTLPGWLGAGGTMDAYQGFIHTLGGIATGGFTTEARSIGAFGALTQWTMAVLMAVAGANFLILHRAFVQRRVREAARDEELRLYVAVLVVVGLAIGALLWSRDVAHGEAALRAGVFQVTSFVTTSGYFTDDYDQWPTFALMALALLFFAGGCAGSTSGSIKMVRHLILARLLGREVVRTVHPELVRPVRLNGAVVDERTQLAVISFVLIYVAVFVLGTAVLAAEATFHGPSTDVLDLVFASAASLGNAGAGLGPAGTKGSFEPFGDVSTVAMTVLMWIGRLEIVPVVVLLRRSYWRV
jgi:trk system potassium uptake protein TrkH